MSKSFKTAIIVVLVIHTIAIACVVGILGKVVEAQGGIISILKHHSRMFDTITEIVTK